MIENKKNSSYVFEAIILAIGITITGFFIGNGLGNIKTVNRSVSVRGLSERAVTADMAQLIINIQHTGNDPTAIFPAMLETQKQVISFLSADDIAQNEIAPGQWITVRTSEQDLATDPQLPHLTISSAINVTTHNVAAVQKLFSQLNDLRIKTGGGVADAAVTYNFTGIGPLRADMIADATKDARNAALQFAKDSNSKVGLIHNASQGVFQIMAAGQESDDPAVVDKIVRVVTTIDYELKD